jgi:hypothetical protein
VTVTADATESPVMPVQQGGSAVMVAAVAPDGNAVAPVMTVTDAPAPVAPMHDLPVIEQAADESPEEKIRRFVVTAQAEIAVGVLRPTVTEIQKRFRCRQAIASAVRKRLEPQT